MFFIFIFIAFIVSVPLYLDYKKNPTDNITTRAVSSLSSNPKIAPILDKIKPHSMKYGIHPLYALGGGIFILLLLLTIIF